MRAGVAGGPCALEASHPGSGRWSPSSYRRIPHDQILDLPAGTGKLAPVFAALGGAVVACDISASMLEIARREYPAAGCTNATFRVCDAEQIAGTLGQRFDVAVCLRLLHRVPSDVRDRVLAELAAVADHAIVSMGIETGYHRARRQVRGWLFGVDTDSLCYDSLRAVETQFRTHFDILAPEVDFARAVARDDLSAPAQRMSTPKRDTRSLVFGHLRSLV